MVHQLPILIVVVPLMASLAAALGRGRFEGPVFGAALLALSSCFAGSCLVLGRVMAQGPIAYNLGSWPPPWGIAIRVDGLGGLMLVLVHFLGLMTAVWARSSVQRELPGRETLFWALFLMQMTGLSGMIVTADMFNLFVLLEVSSLTSYALVAVGGPNAAVAGLRYLILGTVGACFYLLGVGYLYLATGTLNMADLARLLPELYESRLVMTAFVFVMLGFGIKIALFPLHAWQPDAYTLAPSAVSLLISTAVAKTFAFCLVRVMFSVFTPSFLKGVLPVCQTLAWLGAAAILAGSLFAIAQDDLKRMLAYSSVANVGYIVLGTGLALSSRLGLVPAVVHLVNHAVIKGAMFMAACSLIHCLGIRKIQRARGVSSQMPLTVMVLVLAALSMIGLPPGAGFVSKWLLLQASVESGQYGAAGVIVVSTLLMTAYFWRVIETLYIQPPDLEADGVQAGEVPLAMTATGLFMAGLTFILGLVWISGALSPLLAQINQELGLVMP